MLRRRPCHFNPEQFGLATAVLDKAQKRANDILNVRAGSKGSMPSENLAATPIAFSGNRHGLRSVGHTSGSRTMLRTVDSGFMAGLTRGGSRRGRRASPTAVYMELTQD